jgi:NCAIR mutase (PurE)-related protein
MDRAKLEELLKAVSQGALSPSDALESIKNLPYQDLGFATLDSHRGVRQGLPEVVFCPGKTSEQIVQIMRHLYAHHELVLATRATVEVAQSVRAELPGVVYNEQARTLILGDIPETNQSLSKVNIVCAGTADVPVAEEAAMVLSACAIPVNRLYDVGVAGIHRLLDRLPELRSNPITIVIAGMDGALPSVVAGLLEGPVIAVPTSIGYGANFQGVAPLLTMLNSCAAGLTVVNIDNGFGAAVAAFRVVAMVKSAIGTERY